MCDTFVALANATEDGSVIFGKNSDRDANEAHELVIIPHIQHPEGSFEHCTYIDIPQVAETNAVLLAKPFWIWGAEMGANEHNVVIGNEAVFTKVPYGKKPGLIGMDFLRLALERAESARQALDVIVNLLEKYGQSGNCGFAHTLFYHNSFLIADLHEAWVLETAGKHWAAEKVKDIRSISNAITIRSTWDLASEDLVSHAIEKGWCKDRDTFNFSKCYSDLIYTRFSDSHKRQCRTTELLKRHLGKISLNSAMQILRDHGAEAGKDWSPDKGLFGAEVCMHASSGPVRGSQSTGSMISHLKDGKATHWLTGTSAPCSGIFKPVWLDSGLPDLGPAPTGTYDENTLWWRHENLHRELLRDYALRIELYQNERDTLEQEFITEAKKASSSTKTKRFKTSEVCFGKALEATERWVSSIKTAKLSKRRSFIHKLVWDKLDRQARRQ